MKTEKIGKILIWLVAILMIISAIIKFIQPQQIIDEFTIWNLLDYLFIIAAMELIIGILLIIPATNKIGAFLTSAYFGGAIATHLTANQLAQLLLPISFLAVLIIGILLKHPKMLLK